MQSGGAVRVASEYEAMKLSHKYLDIGADVIMVVIGVTNGLEH